MLIYSLPPALIKKHLVSVWPASIIFYFFIVFLIFLPHFAFFNFDFVFCPFYWPFYFITCMLISKFLLSCFINVITLNFTENAVGIFIFFKYILLIMLLQLSHFFLPFIPLYPVPSIPASFLHLSSCPWVIHISSLATPFPILFLTFPCLVFAYHLCFLFPVLFPCHSSPHTHWKPSMWSLFLWFCSCSSCLLSFCFLSWVVDSYEFVVILLFIVFDLLQFLI